MTAPTTKKPPHIPTHFSLTLEGGHAQPLLGREITLFFGGADKKANTVITTVGEIYQRCKKALSGYVRSLFEPGDADRVSFPQLFIKGSCVAHIFSRERFWDIDIHAIIDLRNLSEHQRVGKGYAFKWAVLDAISEIISQTLPSIPGGRKESIPSAEILFEEEANLLCVKGYPFNVHTIRFPGEIPVEFSMFNIVQEGKGSVRNYDFNSGSLQLCIEDGGAITVHSSSLKIGPIIDELSRRELTCIHPEEIEKRGISRYFGKVVLSGYYDKDTALLGALLRGVKERSDGKPEKIIVEDILKEIVAHFQKKGVSPLAALLPLWLLPKPVDAPEMLIALLEEAKEKLKDCLLKDPLPERQALSILVQKGNKAECCWYLIMQAKSARKVVHRAEESLQLEISSYPMFSNDISERSVFMIVPISGLAKFSKSVITGAFLAHQQKDIPTLEVEGADTKALLQSLSKEVLTKPSLYPILSIALGRFGIEMGPDFSKLFIVWVETLSEEEIQCIPLPMVVSALENIKIFREENPFTILILLKRVHTIVGKESICSFESYRLDRISSCCVQHFLKRENWKTISSRDKQVILDFGRALLLKNCIIERLQVYKAKDGEYKLFCINIVNILYMLYQNDHLGITEGIRGARVCLELEHPLQALRFFELLVEKESSLDGEEIRSLFQSFSEIKPLEYAQFLIKYSRSIKTKKADFNESILLPFIEKLKATALSPELEARLVDVIEAFSGEEERKRIIKILFMSAATGNPQSISLLEAVRHRSQDFKWIGDSILSLDDVHLKFLTQLPGLALLFSTDPEFSMDIINRARELQNLELIITGSMHLANTFPDLCLDSLYALDSLRENQEDLKTLHPSLKILFQLLENHPGLIISNSKCRSLIEARLKDLSSYLLSEGGKGKILDEEFFPVLQKFHKQVAVYTMENSFWPDFWEIVKYSDKDIGIDVWINLADLYNVLTAMKPTDNVKVIIETFAINDSIAYEFIRQISRLPKELHEDFEELIELLLQKRRYSILKKAPAELPQDSGAVIYFMNNILKKIDINPVESAEELYLIINICSFIALCSDKKDELELLRYLNSLYRWNENGGLQGILEGLVDLHKILFFLAERALERKEREGGEILLRIQSCYQLWAGKKTPTDYLSPAEFDSHCRKWEIFLSEIFSVPDFIFKEEDFQLLLSYSTYLVNTAKHLSSEDPDVVDERPLVAKKKEAKGAKQVDIKEFNFQHILQLIDFIKRKRLIHSVKCLDPVLLQVSSLDPDQQLLLTSRFIYMAINVLKSNKLQVNDLEIANCSCNLIRDIYVLIGIIEPSGERVIDRKVIADLLEILRELYPHLREKSIAAFYACMIENLEGCLNKREMIGYHESWMQSILSRKLVVQTVEICEWVALTFRLTPDYVEWAYLNNVNRGKFKDKLFIKQDYFNNQIFIENFMKMIDLGITIYASLKKEGVPEEREFAVHLRPISLFVYYANYLKCGMEYVKSRLGECAEIRKLEIFGIDILRKYLEIPKSSCNSYPLNFLLRYIIEERSGTFVFRKIPEEKPANYYVRILYLIAKHMYLLNKEDFAALHKDLLKTIYLNEQKTICKLLAPSQIEEVRFAIFELNPPETFVGGAASSSS